MSSKITPTARPNKQTEFSSKQKFNFSCHAGLACFNHCCRDINIFLSPYDVLRMSKKLNLSAQNFLKQYTIKWQPGEQQSRAMGFFLVLIKMQTENDLKCPFVAEKGCLVYDERPWACRMAPVEIRGQDRYGFVFDSNKCLGLLEPKEWTVKQWMANQGSDNYAQLEHGLEQIPKKVKFTGFNELDQKLRDLVFMACYELDLFRHYVLSDDFLQLFSVPTQVAEKIEKDEVALMQWGLHWLTHDFDLRKALKVYEQVFGRRGDPGLSL